MVIKIIHKKVNNSSGHISKSFFLKEGRCVCYSTSSNVVGETKNKHKNKHIALQGGDISVCAAAFFLLSRRETSDCCGCQYGEV